MAKVTGKATAKASADEGLTEDEILAYTILGEAGGEGRTGMAAVMHVIQNRANSGEYPSSLSSVALQKSSKGTYQFTTWSKKYGNNPKGKYSKDSEAFKEALQIVQTVKAGAVKDPTGGALNYYANQGASGISQPWWFNGEASGGAVQIGNHVYAAKSAVDPKVTQGYENQLAAAMAGTAYPASMSPVTSQKRTASRINYLPASQASLQLGLKSAPIGQTRSRGEAATAARNLSSVGGGLVTRKVGTVPINPLTGQPDTAGNVSVAQAQLRAAITRAAAGNRPAGTEVLQAVHDKREAAQTAATRNVAAVRAGIPPPAGVYPGSDAYKRWEAQVVQSGGVPQHIVRPGTTDRVNAPTTTVRKDGTTSVSDKPGSVALPDGVRPSILPKMPVTPSWTTKLVTKTITVKNPKYTAVNPTAVKKLQDIHDKEDARIMAAQTPLPMPVEPEFIEQQIVVEQRVPVLVKPKVAGPGIGPQAETVIPQARTAVQQLRDEGLSPSQAYDQANKNARDRARQRSTSLNGGRPVGSSSSGRFYNIDTNTWE